MNFCVLKVQDITYRPTVPIVDCSNEGNHSLVDQFEWDLSEEQNSPEVALDITVPIHATTT